MIMFKCSILWIILNQNAINELSSLSYKELYAQADFYSESKKI